MIYIVKLFLLTNKCQQRGSTDYVLGVAHNTSHILILATIANFSRLLRLGSTAHGHVPKKMSSTSSSFHVLRMLGLIQAVAGQKLHLQFLRAIPPSLTTPVS